MLESLHEDVSIAEQKLKQTVSKSKLVRLLTLGIVSGESRIIQAEKVLQVARKQLGQYQAVKRKASALDEELVRSIEMEGVRISNNTFSDLSAVDHDDYPSNWKDLRREVLDRDSKSCQQGDGACDGPLQIHHIQELSKGGTNDLGNLITLCLYHHCTKHPHMMKRYYGNLRS